MKYFIGLLPFLTIGLLIAFVVISIVKKIKQQRAIERKLKELEDWK